MKKPKRFPNVFFGRYQVWSLSPLEIDELLENGWFRNGHYVQTTLGRLIDKSWRPNLMVRVPIEGFSWKKRLRKLLRRNNSCFEVKIGPFQPREEINDLWSDFKKQVHGWENPSNFSYHVLKGNHPSAFNTHEIAVYNDGKIIAFSIFDHGQKSIASLEAAYDVSYASFSLGIFTMLVELQYCIENGMSYYYPGFYPKGLPMFDYKLRTGYTEFFRAQSNEWLPWHELSEEDWLLETVIKKLNMVSSLVTEFGFRSSVRVFDNVIFPTSNTSLANYNFHLVAEGKMNNDKALLVQIAHDPFKNKFFLFKKIILISPESSIGKNYTLVPAELVGGYTSLLALSKSLKKILEDGMAP